MNPIVKEIKQELKKLIEQIRINKTAFKDSQRAKKPSWESLQKMHRAQKEYRHRHIARCLLRGRTYEQIEQKTRDDNRPDESLIIIYKDEYEQRFKKHEDAVYATNYTGA